MSNFQPTKRQSVIGLLILLGALICLVIGVAAVVLLWWQIIL